MRQALFHFLSALTAARGVLGSFSVSQSTLSSTTRLIPVLVGGNSLTFTPNSVTAQPGDVIQFQFAARNHTVTQSDVSTPCQPAASGKGMNSGFIPFDGGASGMVGTFNMPITSTQPMYLYCAQANHCQSGMVMTINGDADQLITYANAAAAAQANVPASSVVGGIAAQIPIANAIVPAAPASSAPATSRATGGAGGQTSTVTKGGGTATATAIVTVGVGGGTATQFATATVGASGAAAATGLSPSGGGTVAGGLAANGSSAQPATFTGGSRSLREDFMDVLVIAGAMSLGSVLLTARR